MVKIMSEQGYPKDGELLVRVDYFIKEGGILIIGKDNQGREYKPKNEPAARNSYVLPSGVHYGVAVGSDPEKNHPAVYFPFKINCRLSFSEIVAKADANEVFFDALDMKVMDDSGKPISLEERLDKLFKFVASYAVLELADIAVQGGVRNHFWGEMYIPNALDIEKFLEAYRG